MVNRRGIKALFSTGLIGWSIFIFGQAYLPYRATTDEKTKIPDLVTIIDTGRLIDPIYFSGMSYQVLSGELLLILGLDQNNLQWLSPLIGGFGFFALLFITYKLYDRQASKYPWAVFGPASVFFIFSTFSHTYRESSHKTYVITLAFLMFYLTYKIMGDKNERRYRLLLIFFAMAIASYNYIWAIIYSGGVGIALFTGFRWVKVRAITITGTAIVSAFAFTMLLPNVRIHRAAVIQVILMSGGLSETGSYAVSSTSNWRIYEIAGIKFPSVLLWMFGIEVMAILTVIGGVLVTIHLYSHKSDDFERVFFGLGVFFAVFVGLFIARGDLPSIRRISKFAAMFAIIFWIRYLVDQRKGAASFISDERATQLLTVIIIILLIGVLLAIPRVEGAGGEFTGIQSPNDYYFSDNEVAKLEYLSRYALTTCMRSANSNDEYTRGKLLPLQFDPIGDVSKEIDHVVYDSGYDGMLLCPEPLQ